MKIASMHRKTMKFNMSHSMRNAGLMLIAGWGVFSLSLEAAPLEISSVWPKGSTWYQDLELAASQIPAATQGRVEVVLQEKSAINKIPELALYTMPLLFRGEAELNYVRERLDADLLAKFAERGMVIWDLETIGTAHLFSKLPIDSLEGFLSSRVWVPKDSHDVKYDEVGLKHPVPLDFRLLRDALRNDEIDTFMLTPTAALLKRYHTRVAVVSQQPLTFVVAPLSVQKETLANISPEDQALVKDKMVEAFKRAARTNREKDVEAMKTFGERDELKVSDAIDYSQEAWQSWAENVRNRLANGKFVPKEMYEKAKNLLAEYRSQHPNG